MVIDHNAGIYISKEDYGSGTNVIGVGNIYDNDIFDGEIYRFGPVNDDRFLLEENDLIYGESSLVPEGIARTVCVGKNGAGSAFAWHTRRVKLDQNIVNSHFATLELNYNISIRKYLMSVSTQTALTGMTTEGYFGATLMLPSVKEQASISDFFKNIEHLITLHQCKNHLFEHRNQYVWEQRKLGEIVDRVTRKNQDLVSTLPLTISAQYGLIDQNEFFDKRVASKDVSGYYLVNKGEFAYNKSTSSDAPWGAIKRLDRYENGVLSTLYIVFAINENAEVDSDYLVTYYDTDLWHRGIREIAAEGARNHGLLNIAPADFFETSLAIPQDIDEQKAVGRYFSGLNTLITLHQCKCIKTKKKCTNDWEQRKFGEIVEKYEEPVETPTDGYMRLGIRSHAKGTFHSYVEKGKELETAKMFKVAANNFIVNITFGWEHAVAITGEKDAGKLVSHRFPQFSFHEGMIPKFFRYLILDECFRHHLELSSPGGAGRNRVLKLESMLDYKMCFPITQEQEKIAEYFDKLDTLITLHRCKYKRYVKYSFFARIQCKSTIIVLYIQFNDTKEILKMPELETIIEQKLIEQLVYGDSQWVYRADLKTEEDLWTNFKYILEQNNKDRLNGENLSESEFEQVKNQLQFSSFYKAGEWLVGENGKVMVHVQRDTERLHLVVMNHEHIAGGSSVYEVINQYSTLKADKNDDESVRNRRFDVTLMINGLPMIHIELKNKQHSYMDAFWQIKKYIGEGKFTGIFSAVQMFVISNGVDTKYFSAASDAELNPKFISGWLDKDNNPVTNYLDFAKSVLRIPEAHEMVARYTVLDEDAKKLILLRPYQIHAIESIREASKRGKSGFVWHTTGSGKTLTSYKATRNLLMDIPSIDKAIFLIDRKDLDTQTTMAFQAYANNDLIDVDETDNVYDLMRKLKSDDRQVIVTTIQKLQRLITKKLEEGTPEYNKIKNLKIAYVVDECHRAVTPATKRELERFFANSLWFGFTGTPRFAENPYPQMGDLPRTTEELYGERLHKYTIQNAIHDNAVLGFQVEHNGPKNMIDETDSSLYDNETHMLKVLDVILNKSYHKLGFQNGKGKTYEALLTTNSIQMAQKYYELLTRVKNGETTLVIDEKVKQVLPDFPKFAITYSVTENEEGSQVNQQKMQGSLDDYNKMFGTKFELAQIQAYNGNLNKRLARKDPKFQSRNEQLDLVIVVDRLLTGFDAPCMSTIFIDRQPMGPHDLIQAFSRTNRIFDKNKTYGQIVTFQAPVLFKECVDNAVKLYSAGSTEGAVAADWDEIELAFRKALAALRVCAETPSDISGMSLAEKKVFVKIFQNFDKLFAQLKSFTKYEDSMLDEYGISEEEYYDYAGCYKNAVEEIKIAEEEDNPVAPVDPVEPVIDPDYELMAYSNTKIDYEYIIGLIQNIVTLRDDAEVVTPEERQKKIDEVKQYVEELRKSNAKIADIMSNLISEIELDENKYRGQSILNIVENMKNDCVDRVVSEFCVTWYASKEDVMYAATHYRNGEIPNESAIKATVDYTSYKLAQENALPKFKFYAQMMAELKKTLKDEIEPLISH